MKFLLSIAVMALIAGNANIAVAQQDPAVIDKQDVTVLEYWEVDDDSPALVERFGLSVMQLDDMDVYGPTGEKIGEIEEVLMDESREIRAFVVETEGFLGFGKSERIVELDHFNTRGNQLTTSLSEEQLDAMPEWDD